ncbi:MAG: hypothetical protein BWY75_03373 [bacterium ADurb.Bin425]|nr:MAG: hypothetical protein BWY75_03373 [bacterium ADurb.Bin425]
MQFFQCSFGKNLDAILIGGGFNIELLDISSDGDGCDIEVFGGLGDFCALYLAATHSIVFLVITAVNNRNSACVVSMQFGLAYKLQRSTVDSAFWKVKVSLLEGNLIEMQVISNKVTHLCLTFLLSVVKSF